MYELFRFGWPNVQYMREDIKHSSYDRANRTESEPYSCDTDYDDNARKWHQVRRPTIGRDNGDVSAVSEGLLWSAANRTGAVWTLTPVVARSVSPLKNTPTARQVIRQSELDFEHLDSVRGNHISFGHHWVKHLKRMAVQTSLRHFQTLTCGRTELELKEAVVVCRQLDFGCEWVTRSVASTDHKIFGILSVWQFVVSFAVVRVATNTTFAVIFAPLGLWKTSRNLTILKFLKYKQKFSELGLFGKGLSNEINLLQSTKQSLEGDLFSIWIQLFIQSLEESTVISRL